MSELNLRPLRADDAEAMAAVLSDVELYAFIGGHPPTVSELAQRYSVQARGASADGSEEWINLIVELGEAHEPIGYVQATIIDDVAEIAWVIGRRWQGMGHGTRAAALLVEHLRGRSVAHLIAHIHPDHQASNAVASGIGMSATEVVIDGEVRWERELAIDARTAVPRHGR